MPLTALSSDDGKEAFRNFPSYPTLLSVVCDIKKKFKTELKKKFMKYITSQYNSTAGHIQKEYVI